MVLPNNSVSTDRPWRLPRLNDKETTSWDLAVPDAQSEIDHPWDNTERFSLKAIVRPSSIRQRNTPGPKSFVRLCKGQLTPGAC